MLSRACCSSFKVGVGVVALVGVMGVVALVGVMGVVALVVGCDGPVQN